MGYDRSLQRTMIYGAILSEQYATSQVIYRTYVRGSRRGHRRVTHIVQRDDFENERRKLAAESINLQEARNGIVLNCLCVVTVLHTIRTHKTSTASELEKVLKRRDGERREKASAYHAPPYAHMQGREGVPRTYMRLRVDARADANASAFAAHNRAQYTSNDTHLASDREQAAKARMRAHDTEN
eukprot:6212103-Pleurochrysis_carterae.AAC.1